ncbi:MAG TPA: SMP-30/gluconolactonase/LRE family protein [Chryseosolibacter sp.]|nr:SMP-30/gluconolactonase/LRE family protein [Chryseosolibacter sp.]
MKRTVVFLLFAATASCKVADKPASVGSIERIDAAFDDIVDPDASFEVLADGYDWAEGPLWIESEKALLFSDVPMNIIYKWTEDGGATQYLKPSGFTSNGSTTSHEPGSNGLALDTDGRLIVCQQGDRRIAALDAPLNAPKATFAVLTDNYNGKKFNSPNDVVVRSNGDLFFTDPPYGMPEGGQEIPFHGVYKVSGGVTTLLVDSLTRPNGLAFLPGENTLLIANSDSAKAMWYAYDLAGDSLTNARIFYKLPTAALKESGLPDGLKIDRQGNVFATGPGGIWVFNREAKLLGKIRIPVATGNCAFSDDQKTLFITADHYLLRLKMRD